MTQMQKTLDVLITNSYKKDIKSGDFNSNLTLKIWEETLLCFTFAHEN